MNVFHGRCVQLKFCILAGRAVPDDSRYSLLPSGTLRLLRVEPGDAGSFRCDGANAYGEQHAEVTLTVIDQVPLTFIRCEQILNFGSHQNTCLCCLMLV